MDAPARAFISYARSDGEAFASALRRRLQREHPALTLWQDRTELEGGVGWWRQIAEALDQVEILIMVLTPAVAQSAVAQKEWRYARQQGVRVCPVLGVEAGTFDFAQLPSWMRKAHCYDLEKEWATFIGYLSSARAESRVPFMAPDLRQDFVDRPAEYSQLASMLLDRSRMNPLAITTALQGAGGFGKTTLAAALCHDDDIITAFDDGVLWVTLGERPLLQQELTKLYAALTGERPTFVDADDASIELAARLEDKNCLIVIDDVWDPNDAKPFLRGGRQCARLITTRRLQVVTGVAANRVVVDEMTGDQAVAMLMARLPQRPTETLRFRRLAERLGEWPLLLRLAASQLRERVERGDSVAGALDFVNRALDKRGAVAFDRANASSRSDAVATTVAASLALLPKADRARAMELAIFSEAKVVPLSAAAALWALDAFDTEDLVQRLDDASIVEFDLKTGTLRMHDVLRSHLQTQLEAARDVHARLVQQGWPDPHALPDAFAWRWFGWHLVQAGQRDRLRELLLDYGWLAAKLSATDVHALLQDYDAAGPDDAFVTIRDAVRLSAFNLGRDPAQLAGQLRGRLAGGQNPRVDRVLDSAARHERGALRLVYPSLSTPGGPLVAILKGHRGPIEALGVWPDGSRAVTGSTDRTLRVWDLEAWRPLPASRVLEGHAGTIHAVAVTPDGARIISGSEDRALRVWNVESGECLAVLKGHHEAVRGVAVAPDGRSVASLSEDGTVRLWDLADWRSAQLFKGSFHQLRGIAFTPDGSCVVFGAGDGSLRVLDVATRREVQRIDGQQAIFSACAVTADGRHVLAGAEDGSLRLWDLASREVLRTFGGHGKGVRSVALTADGGRAVSGGSDRMVREWDVRTGEALNSFEGHSGAVTGTAVLADGRRIVTASGDGTVCGWRLDGQPRHAQARPGAISKLVISPDGSLVASVSTGPAVQVWDGSSGRIVATLEGHTRQIHDLRMTSDGRRLLTASHDRTLRFWDLEARQTVHVLDGHWGAVATTAMTSSGHRAVSLSHDRTVRLWDLDHGRVQRVLVDRARRGADYLRARALASDEEAEFHLDSTDATIARGASLSISPDGAWALFADGGSISRWDLDTGRVVTTTIQEFHTVELGVSDDTVVAGSIVGAICQIDPANGGVRRVLDAGGAWSRTRHILDLVVDIRGQQVIAASRDGHVRVWDLASGLETASIRTGVEDVDAAAIAPNGRFVYSVVGDTVLASDLVTRGPSRRLSIDHNIRAIAVTPDGRRAALGDESGRVHVLTLDVD